MKQEGVKKGLARLRLESITRRIQRVGLRAQASAARISRCAILPKAGTKAGPRLVFNAGAGVDSVECTPESVESFVGGGEDLFFGRRIV